MMQRRRRRAAAAAAEAEAEAAEAAAAEAAAAEAAAAAAAAAALQADAARRMAAREAKKSATPAKVPAAVVTPNGAPPKPNGAAMPTVVMPAALGQLRKFAAAAGDATPREKELQSKINELEAELDRARERERVWLPYGGVPADLPAGARPAPNRVPPWLRGGAGGPPTPPWAAWPPPGSPQAALSPGTPTPPWAATRGPAYLQNVPS